jgi:hypothetical protein
LQAHKIRQIFTPAYKPTSNSVVERLNRTLKMRLFAVMTQRDTRRWIDLLPGVQANINSSVHRNTGFTPNALREAARTHDAATLATAAARLKSLAEERLQRAQRRARPLPDVRVGDTVRVAFETMASQRKLKMRKSYVGNWSRDLFTVTHISAGSSVNLPQFRLRRSPDGDAVHQRYYRRDVQLVDLDALQLAPEVGPAFVPPASLLLQRRTDPRPRKVRRPGRFLDK